MGQPSLFAGAFVKFLKASLNLGDKAYIIPGQADPSSVATSGPASSLYLKSSPSIDVAYDNSFTGAAYPGFAGKWGNVFTATATATITEAAVYAGRSGPTTGNVYVKIYTVVGNHPVLPVLATSNPVDSSTLPLFPSADNAGLVNFTFPTAFQLQSGTQYAFIYDFSAQSPGSNAGMGRGPLSATYVGWENGFSGGTGDTFIQFGVAYYQHLRTQQAGSGAQVLVKQDAGSTTNWTPLASLSSTLYTATKSPADGFAALVSDRLDSTSKLNTVLTQGTYSKTSAGTGIYALSADKTKTVTTSGTGYTLSAAPGFTVTPGCIIYFNALGVFRQVLTVTSQTVGVLDVALPSNVTSVAGMVSQAVWTADLTNIGDPVQATRLRDFFPATSNTKVHLEYSDSLASADSVPDFTSAALIVASVSNTGLQTDVTTPTTDTFSPIYTRPTAPASVPDYALLTNTNQQRLFAVFFPNPNNGSVTNLANLLSYDLSAYIKTVSANGGTLNSSYVQSDGSGTAVNSGNPTFTGGNTQIVLGYNFTPGINPGTPDGDIEVIVEGQVIPRFFTGVVGSYYTEVAGTTNTIQISGNLTTLSPSVSIHTRRRQGQIDTGSINSLKFAALYSAIVGSASQVAAGVAGYTTITSAVAANPTGRILVLAGTYTENLTLVASTNDQLVIDGQGRGTVLSGNLTMGGSYTDLVRLKVTGAISITGNSNFLRGWLATAGTFANTGTGNTYQVNQE